MNDFQFCHSYEFQKATSSITGHRILVNLSYDKVLVPPNVDIARAIEVGKGLIPNWDKNAIAHGNDWTTSRDLRTAIQAFATVSTSEEFMLAIDGMLGLVATSKSPRGYVFRSLICLTHFWSHDLLAVPPKWTTEYRINCPISAFTVGHHRHWIAEVAAVATAKSPKETKRSEGLALRYAGTAIGIKEVGDITPATTSEIVRSSVGTRSNTMAKMFVDAQSARYGRPKCPTLQDWGLRRYHVRKKGDVDFRWATREEPSLEQWRLLLAEWLAQRPVKSQALRLGESFLNYLLANCTVTRSPEMFCLRSYTPPVPFRDWLHQRHKNANAIFDNNNLCSEFLDWLLDTHISAPDDYGRPVRSTDHWNPISRLRRKQQAIQTHREAIPTRYLRELIRILTEDNYAWPKSLSSEFINWYDPDDQTWKRIWNPVRVSALLLKLYLPLRTIQVRMLDSGEADSQQNVDGQWIPNTGPLAPAQSSVVRRGFLRKFTDSLSGKTYTGFYVNTNKTQDRGRNESCTGYEIPWQHEEAIAVALYLLRWQRKHNPLHEALRWADLRDQILIRSGRSGKFAAKGEACFLFRDLRGTYPNEPLTDSRLRPFWVKLLDELERRVAARGETLPDGSTIRFIRKRKLSTGEPIKPAYDLHSLRVSLITALAIDGGVPIPILSKCIAGHASILMTLYYVKLGALQINERLAQARKRIDYEEQRNFLRFLQSAEYSSIVKLAAGNDSTGLNALDKNAAGSWIIGDKGICPVGGALCDKGGPKLTSNPQLSDYAPTPGGQRNCIRCRFFITGPAFLGGLVAHFNAVGVQLLAASERFRDGEARIRDLEDTIARADERNPRSSLMADLEDAYELHQRGMQEVDNLAHNLHAIYRLTERCKTIAAEPIATPSNGVSLVLAGQETDFHAAIEMTTDFELMNSVCQVARVYPNNDSTLANLRRSRILDAMLDRNGLKPVFSTLSEQEALTAGNEFVNLLITRFGYSDALAVIEGKNILDASEIGADIKQSLGRQSVQPFDFTASVIEPLKCLPTAAKKHGAKT